jgi:alkylation response protein AidB-like acyl-CoA dehydrogenase
VSVSPIATIGAAPVGVVSFKDAEIEGWIGGQAAVDYLRVVSSALSALESYAYAQKALDMTVEYVQMRVQFGQPIGAFQAVQNRVADMAILVEAAKFLSRELLWNLDQGNVDEQQAAIVKAMTAQSTPQVVMDCHLLHGGIGYMQEYPLQTYTRRIKESSLSWGSTREMLNRVADAVLA